MRESAEVEDGVRIGERREVLGIFTDCGTTIDTPGCLCGKARVALL